MWVRDSFVRESLGTASEHHFSYGTTREPRHQAVREWLVQNEALEEKIRTFHRDNNAGSENEP